MNPLVAYGPALSSAGGELGALLTAFLLAYLIGSIPFAYIIVKLVTGEDVTAHGTGNVGAMNVRRATGSWGWFAVAMLCDAMKGFIPVAATSAAVSMAMRTGPLSAFLPPPSAAYLLLEPLVVAGCVLGHNYSFWIALLKGRFSRTGKGLATGAGALLAYDWRYFVAVVVVGLMVIGMTKYMMAGQVAAALTLPVAAVVLGSPDWPFALLMGAVVYAAHHKRFVGMLRGREPKLYVNDAMGPRG